MSDFSASLPIRTESNTDVVIAVADGTITSQLMSVNADGSINIKQSSAASLNATVTQGTSPWVSKDQSDGPVAPGAVASFSSLIGGQYNTSLPTLTNGQQSAAQFDVNGKLLVLATTGDDHNYGVVGATTLRTAAEIGNATGPADFNSGSTGAQTIRTHSNQGVPNTAGNAWPISVTSGGALNSATNPIFVSLSDVAGTSIDNYNTSAALAAGGTSNHDYTVTAAKTFYTKQFLATASGKLKIEVQYETGAATGIFNSVFVGFNSSANPNITIPVPTSKTQVAGAKIRIIRTNEDKVAMDVYSTTSGSEV